MWTRQMLKLSEAGQATVLLFPRAYQGNFKVLIHVNR